MVIIEIGAHFRDFWENVPFLQFLNIASLSRIEVVWLILFFLLWKL